MLQRRNMSLLCAVTCAAVVSAANASFVYDTTLGTYMDYDGDLTAGLLNINEVDGRSFRVQVLDTQTVLGTFGVGGASLSMQTELVSFTDAGGPGYGPGDFAILQGVPGAPYDFLITDSFGQTLSGKISLLELFDRTNSPVLKGVEGQAFLTDVVFSGPTFQGVNVPPGLDKGSFYMFIETTSQWSTLGQMLEIGGEGIVYTIDMTLIPAPATLALFAAAGLVVRRRR